MTEQEEQLKAITEMRDLMNKSSRFISMSGWSGVSAGLFGLIASFLFYRSLGDMFFDFPLSGDVFANNRYGEGATVTTVLAAIVMVQTLAIIATVTLVSAVFSAWFFTWRRAKKLGLSMWDDTARRLTLNFFIPLAAGGGFCLVLASHGMIGLLPGATLLFYGLALLNASKYTFNDIRYLALMEIGLGFIASAYYQYSLVLWGIGFGVLHVVYGILLYFKHETKKG